MATNRDSGFDMGAFMKRLEEIVNDQGSGGGFGGGFDFSDFLKIKGVGLAGDLLSTAFGGARKERREAKGELKSSRADLLKERDTEVFDPFEVAGFARKASSNELRDAASKLAEISGGQLSDFDIFGALREKQADTLTSSFADIFKESKVRGSQKRERIDTVLFERAMQRFLYA